MSCHASRILSSWLKQAGSADDKDIRPAAISFRKVARFAGTVHLQFRTPDLLVHAMPSSSASLSSISGMNRLSGKAGIDSHDRNFIGLMDIVFHGLNWRLRVEDQPHFHVMTADFINQAERLSR